MNSFFPGSYWWLRGVQGVIAGIIGLCILVFLIGDIRGGVLLSAVSWIMFAIICMLCWGISILSTLQAFETRRWFHTRLQAIQGHNNTIPLADLSLDPNYPAGLTDESLTLLWHSKSGWRHAWIGISLFLYLFLASLTGVGIFAAYTIVIKNFLSPHPVEISIITVLTIGIMIAGPFTGLVILSRIPLKRNNLYGIEANAEGFFYYPQLGKTRFLRWEDIRLFEVEGTHNPHYHIYRLYGPKAIADWRDQFPLWGFCEPRMTREEFQERHQALLNLIVARTHLMPQTFDKKLAMTN